MTPRRFILAALLALCGRTPAQDIATDRIRVVLHEDEAYERTVFLTAREVHLAGVARDDVFIAAQSVELSGRADNDVWILGAETVSVTGTVKDHARLAGNVITVGGYIGNGLWAAGGTVNVTEDAEVAGETTIWARDVILGGALRGPARITARRVTLAGAVYGDLRIVADDIVALPQARVEGDLIYTAPKEFLPDPRVTITGQQTRVPAAPTPELRGLSLLALASALVAGIPFVLLFPGFAGRGARAVRASFWSSLMIGAIAGGLLPMAILLAFATVVGIPLALALAAAMGLFLYLAQFPVALALGGMLLRRRGPQPPAAALGAFVVGLAALHLLPMIPVAGAAAGLLTTLLGFGALLRALSERRAPPPLPLAMASTPPPTGSSTETDLSPGATP